jgi:uncharacterized repeat protein (TIGR03803 family)
VFKLMGSAETVLYRFQGGSDGESPYAGLLLNAHNGTLYGTTAVGGIKCVPSASFGCGTVFKLTPAGSGYTESVLYRFQGGNDGAIPLAGLIARNGALYGTTRGLNSFGTVFRLSSARSDYKESVLYSFTGGSDGAEPYAGVIADKTGALYGTTRFGGPFACMCGVVFKLTPAGAGYTESVLYGFKGGNDAAQPTSDLIASATGALYGTTIAGGGSTVCGNGCGTVFKLTPAGAGFAESVLYRFTGRSGGGSPNGVIARNGALYGTTYVGGGASCGPSGLPCGTVFQLTR